MNVLLLNPADLVRWDGAACAGADPELFFADAATTRESKAAGKRRRAEIAVAKAICATCEIRPRCEQWVAAHPQLTAYGIWHGATARERRSTHGDLGGDVRYCVYTACGQAFQSTNPQRRYCCGECGDKARRDQQRARDKRRRVAA